MQLVDPTGHIRIEVREAKGLLANLEGLLGRTGLPPACGILLRAKEVHTLGMRFAIDVVYLSRQGVVLRTATMAPGHLGPVVLRARWILEMAAGEAERLGIVPGTTLTQSAG